MAFPISPVAFKTVRWTRITKTLARLTICIVAVTAVTAIHYALPLHGRPLFPALAFLFLILIVSAAWGFRYAVFVSFLATLGFMWLLTPVGQFWPDDPRDWFALASFLVIGIVTSHLSERARRETLNAKQRGAEAVAAHQVARRSEQDLRAVIETMPAMAWTALPDGSNIFASKGWTEYTGLSVEESEVSGWQTATHPEDLDQHLEKWRASLASGHPFESEARLRRTSDGEYRWFLARSVPMRDEQGNILKWYGILTDIEDRKRAEQALREREAKIRCLVDANIIGIFVADLEGRITEANNAFLRLVGYEREDLISGHMHVMDMTPPEWRDRTARTMAEIKLVRTVQPYEKEYFRKDGSRVPVLVGSTPFDESNLGVTLGVVFVVDLTELKQAEKALRESEEQWRAVFENNPTMYFMVDQGGAILSVNPLGAEQLGFTIDELIGHPVLDLFHVEDREAVKRKTAICFERCGQPMNWEARKIRNNGEVLWVRETARVMLIKDRPVALIACEDITERKRVSEALREVQMELAHANRVATMGQLTASIAHEVKQPIAAAMTNAQAALRFLDAQTVDLSAIREILNDIVNDGNRAGEVISRIRDLIKKAAPRRDRWEMNGAVREVIELTRGEAVKNGVSVHTVLAAGLPLIQGDRVQLQQVVLNLILNAVEAMSSVDDAPRVLSISTAPRGADEVLVAVHDSGPGIDSEHLERVFDSFYTTKSSGMGLGLSICRSIIDAHGGRLWADANEPRGVVFQFVLPAVG